MSCSAAPTFRKLWKESRVFKGMTGKQKSRRSKRKFAFSGNSYCDSILIGNYGNARVVAKGQFNLSGILYCLDGRVEVSANGNGHMVFRGKCRHLVIRESDGDCILDFSEVSCDVITCESVKGYTTVILGKTKRVDLVAISEEATVRISSHPLVTARSLEDNARILCPARQTPPYVVHPR